ncbi:LOW QUALITY PROTEIN: voltage-dependent T-type calcium channel subunit alpha-1G-like [Sphaeramia orbicularis]|uniref:LOW QUALITY PROTEIN: voltage-dependent T-type calcium channel subunit alpha-1G-like n=1 Tax=Sphaeramia orbicularis TaxID=375764 RepID=UPI00117CD1CE|nr:LOW QUALITY PROTEIN: voltage-dependent T-type calcium channel subunit alpha-1G-like [Sphaeramia orbicularis]
MGRVGWTTGHTPFAGHRLGGWSVRCNITTNSMLHSPAFVFGLTRWFRHSLFLTPPPRLGPGKPPSLLLQSTRCAGFVPGPRPPGAVWGFLFLASPRACSVLSAAIEAFCYVSIPTVAVLPASFVFLFFLAFCYERVFSSLLQKTQHSAPDYGICLFPGSHLTYCLVYSASALPGPSLSCGRPGPLSVGLANYYKTENDDENPFICSQPRDNGMRDCGSVPKLYEEGGLQCNLDMYSYNSTDNTTCVNWNQYYTNCSAGPFNPFKGAINFDNICYAWIAIFQVITLEGWVDIMYFVMDAHSFYNFIYFILLIIIGSFFMINLCLVVIATQFSETKQRESQLMKEQRVRFMSNASTLASLSEPGSCYDELLKYLVHIIRKGAKQVAHVCRFLARRAGLNIAASPPAQDPQRNQSQRRRRKSSRQGSVSVHHMVHHHHHHYHLGNGSVRGGGSVRGLDAEAAPSNNSGGALIATTCTRHLALAPPPSVIAATSDTNLATLSTVEQQLPGLLPWAAFTRWIIIRDSFCCTPTAPGPFSLAPAPTGRAMKRNSVPFAAPGPKNYPTLQARVLAESRRGSVAASTLTNISFNLNIPPMQLERCQQSLVDTHTATAQLSVRDLSRSSGAVDAAALTPDPDGCPYCAKALANESEGATESNDTPGDSDSEGVYEFTQDLHHRDRRDSRQPRRRHRRLGKTAAKVVHFWRLVCDTFRKIVDSKYFGRGIMIAILINTLSMGIEYHEQPDELTNALEISNIVFTSLFSLEMLLKVLVYGPFGYIKNPYNIFDGIIVVISVWEIVGQQGGGLSVLRTFRLMRVLKLVRFMPALQRQLVVLMKTMDNVATFCMLLMLFIFIFSILGMHLFGCKFGSERDGDTLPDRKNFDSLLWAIVTVFQILTQEDWNKVLYNGMASTTPVAALYFIALMTFGNYVLFNLLVAILVEGFQTEEVSKREDLHAQLSLIQLPVDSGGDASKSGSEIDSFARSMEDVNGSKKDLSASAVVPVNGHVDLKTSLTPPLITHTAATPMPIPKLPVGGDPLLGYESRRGSNVSIDPGCHDKSPISARSSSPYAPWSSGSGRTSRRSSWNSLGRAPSLKRQKRQSGERQSLLSGEGGTSSDEGEGSGEVGGGLMEDDDASLARTDSMSQSQTRHRRMESMETRSSMDLPPDALLQVPFLYRSASMHSSRPPSLGQLHPPEHRDCNGKGSPTALGPTHVSLEENTEDENAEEEVNMSVPVVTVTHTRMGSGSGGVRQQNQPMKTEGAKLVVFARLFRWLEKKQPEWCRQRDTWSLYLFPPESRFSLTLDYSCGGKFQGDVERGMGAVASYTVIQPELVSHAQLREMPGCLNGAAPGTMQGGGVLFPESSLMLTANLVYFPTRGSDPGCQVGDGSLPMSTQVFQQPDGGRSHETSPSHFNRIHFCLPPSVLHLRCQFCVAQFFALIGLFS